ncbi:MAG: hypothetical protein NVSMB1_23580 [Polyangiales bacterium]
MHVRPPKLDKMTETTLHPGDLLYLPAGTWHTTKAHGFSLSLTVTFQPRRPLTLFIRALERLLGERAEWVSSLPPSSSEPSADEALATRFEALLKAAPSLLSQVTAAEMQGLWRGTLGASSPRNDPTTEVPTKITKDDVFFVRSPLSFEQMVPDADGFSVRVFAFNASDIVLTGEALPFLRKLVTVDQFVASEAMSWYPSGYEWNSLHDMLLSFLKEGILWR